MTDRLARGRMLWRDILAAPTVGAEAAEAALESMEFSHTRWMHEQKPAAERIATAMESAGRADLARRARLVLGGIAVREGHVLEAARMLEPLLKEATDAGDSFAMARAHYHLAWVGYFVSDRSTTQIHATHAVDRLPDDAPAYLHLDHLSILATGCGNTREGHQYYDEALALSPLADDPHRTISLHNNIAFSAVESGDGERALKHVALVQIEAERSGNAFNPVLRETVARAYIITGQLQRAIDVLQPVLEEFEAGPAQSSDGERTDPHALLAGVIALVHAHRLLGNFDTAEMLLAAVKDMATGGDLTMFDAEILEEEAHLAAARGDFEAAYRQYALFHGKHRERQSDEQAARARVVRASFDAERSRRDAERFRELAMRDALTGLHNRRYLDELLADEVERARSSGAPLSVGIADADYFKRVNDEHSHEVGDQVLRALASLLVAGQPEGATVCRLGGEEFAIVMPRLGADAALSACEELRRAVADRGWDDIASGVRVTVSIGVTTVLDGRTSPAALLSDADGNLYAAKRSGRNRVMGDVR